ncbi:LOW QUALITY PROTEIN: hypothetical protein YC2023_005906 [Brassica napus]
MEVKSEFRRYIIILLSSTSFLWSLSHLLDSWWSSWQSKTPHLWMLREIRQGRKHQRRPQLVVARQSSLSSPSSQILVPPLAVKNKFLRMLFSLPNIRGTLFLRPNQIKIPQLNEVADVVGSSFRLEQYA